MAAGPWKVYDSAKGDLGAITTDTFYCALFTSTYTPAATDDSYSSLTGEVSNGNGYTTGGVALTGVSWSESSGTYTFALDDIVWNASGGDISSIRYAVIYNYTDAGKQLIAQCVLDSTPADVTVPSGSPLTIKGTNGVLTLSGGW